MHCSSILVLLVSTSTFLTTTTASAANYKIDSNSSSSAIATPTFVTPPPPGETYVLGNPICGVAGFTVVPGNYTETIEAVSNSTLIDCFEACKKNETTAAVSGCQSIAFGPKYTDCLFFDRVVQETQLYADKSSYFVHYDLGCKFWVGA